MTLTVYTARISSRDADAFDVTRATADKLHGGPGAAFAPSWRILSPALRAREDALRELAKGKANPQHRTYYERRALEIDDAAWKAYVPRYRAEMLASHRAHRAAWDQLLARRRVVLVCTCVDGERCHRRLLAGFLARLGAVDQGEVREVDLQGRLF